MSLKVKTRTNGDDRYFTCSEEAENWWWGIKSTCHWLVSMIIDLHSVLLDPLSRSLGLTMAPFTAMKLSQSICYDSQRPTGTQVTPIDSDVAAYCITKPRQ